MYTYNMLLMGGFFVIAVELLDEIQRAQSAA
jgi:hypothetical protein